MSAEDALLFIDANKYLDLYQTDKGKMLLKPLVEQNASIFVTQQVVNEVQRNKIEIVARFLSSKVQGVNLTTMGIPDHLSNIVQSEEILNSMRDIKKSVVEVNAKLISLLIEIIEQVSQSRDEVSEALAPIFSKAVVHTEHELHRARNRRELGCPPGKPGDPIGDQLTWEQILTHFQGKRRLWIISRDNDYGTVFKGKGILNQVLYEELRTVNPSAVVYLFQETLEGIQHFVRETGVKAESQLTPDQVKEIQLEEDSLLNESLASEAMNEYLRQDRAIREAMRPNLAMEAMNEFIRQERAMREAIRPNLASEAMNEFIRQERAMREAIKPNLASEAFRDSKNE